MLYILPGCFAQQGELEPLLEKFTAEEEEQLKRILQRMEILAKVIDNNCQHEERLLRVINNKRICVESARLKRIQWDTYVSVFIFSQLLCHFNTSFKNAIPVWTEAPIAFVYLKRASLIQPHLMKLWSNKLR